MVMDKQKMYCSLDIETSGFDPATNEVLEVGFVFFEFEEITSPSPSLARRGIKITEEWTKVFKPEKEVADILHTKLAKGLPAFVLPAEITAKKPQATAVIGVPAIQVP